MGIIQWIKDEWKAYKKRRACKPHEWNDGELVELGMRKLYTCTKCGQFSLF